jgi:energy-coupling factor transport system substrate-specific component
MTVTNKRSALKSIFRWNTEELVLIGTFAALIKILTLMISLLGGGMNPLSLLLKNVVATSMLVVLLHKVPRTGVLILYVLQQAIIMMMLMGSGIIILPGYLVAAFIAEALALLCGGYHKTGAILVAVACYDLASRCVSMGLGWLFMRENVSLFLMALAVVGFGYIGCLIGLGSGVKFVKEFRNAGFIRR